ncbi:MAG: hypothetical protein PHD36_07610 [Desulfotomaculaceae bacterium]|nr:hypothetical protein [Desulfotomaculaceae bacterium]
MEIRRYKKELDEDKLMAIKSLYTIAFSMLNDYNLRCNDYYFVINIIMRHG